MKPALGPEALAAEGLLSTHLPELPRLCHGLKDGPEVTEERGRARQSWAVNCPPPFPPCHPQASGLRPSSLPDLVLPVWFIPGQNQAHQLAFLVARPLQANPLCCCVDHIQLVVRPGLASVVLPSTLVMGTVAPIRAVGTLVG